MEKHCVYIHKNKINNKVYVGQTKQSVSRRWRGGKGYLNCPKFYNAIQKYGWDNFEHIILKDNLTQEEANELERNTIIKFDSIQNGYNIKEGGIAGFDSIYISNENKKRWKDGVYDNIKTAVYCVELDRYFESALEAERELGVDNSSIQKTCKNKNRYSGFTKEGNPLHWLFVNNVTEEKIKELYNRKETIKGIKIPIYCVELDEIFLDGTRQIKEKYGFDPSSIRKVINGKAKSAYKHPETKEPLHWIERRDLINTKNKVKETY